MPPKKALCCRCFLATGTLNVFVAALQPQAKARVGASVFAGVGGACVLTCNYVVTGFTTLGIIRRGARTQPNQRRWHADGSRSCTDRASVSGF